MKDHSPRNDMLPPRDEDPKDMNSSFDPATIEDTSAPVQFPEAEQIVVTHYAYDPDTYEILCRPGQRLNPKKVQRLRELGLYARVVKLAE